MSLISMKNVAAPFSNKVHLIGIVLVASLFLAYRLSGGALEMSTLSGSSSTNRDTYSTEDYKPRATDRQSTTIKDIVNAQEFGTKIFDPKEQQRKLGLNPTKPKLPPSTAARGDLIQELAPSGSGAQNTNSQNAAARKDDNGGLADIEKQLGLK